MLVVSLLYLAVGGVSLVLAGEVAFASVDILIIGALLLGCFFLSRRAPLAGLGGGLLLWLAAELARVAVSPASFLVSFASASGVAIVFAKLVVLVAFIAGVRAAIAARSILAQHARGR
jgi:hypothetical protein